METTGKENTIQKDEYLNIITNLTNSYFIIEEAGDMILRELKSLLESYDKGLNGRVRQRHNNIMSHVRALENILESFLEDYEAFKGEWKKHDELRASAAYLVRVALLIGDRAACSEEPIEKQIEKFIHDLPPNGYINDHILSHFKLR